MPEYSYACEACRKAYTEFRSMSEGHPKKCPSCGERYGDKYQFNLNFSDMRIVPLVYGNPTTVGQLAEQNSKKMGKELSQLTLEKDKKQMKEWKGPLPEGATVDNSEGETPWWRTGEVPGVPAMEEPLNLRKVADPTKYIEAGA